MKVAVHDVHSEMCFLNLYCGLIHTNTTTNTHPAYHLNSVSRKYLGADPELVMINGVDTSVFELSTPHRNLCVSFFQAMHF